MTSRLGRWLFSPVPRGRVAALRTLLYSFVFVDVLVTTAWVARHAAVPGELYRPLFVGRVLPLPVPTEALVIGVEIGLLAAAAVALTGRLPRLAGVAVFALYFEWMVIAMSYGKVDHDRFAFLVALAVLPTAGPARWGDREPDEAAGWAVRSIQLAVVATYFLSTFAKLRFGGLAWLNGATLMRAVLRRGTPLVSWVTEHPLILRAGQYLLVGFELATPLMLVGGRIGIVFVALAVSFHVITFASIGIIFLPHVMCLAAFLPLERLDFRRLRPARARVEATQAAAGRMR